jgi:hypothetical protein
MPGRGVLAAWPLKMGPIGCPKMSVMNDQHTLHNIPEEWRPQQWQYWTSQPSELYTCFLFVKSQFHMSTKIPAIPVKVLHDLPQSLQSYAGTVFHIKLLGTNPRHQDAKATKFCIVMPNIRGSSVWTLLYVTLPAPRILRCLADIWKICVPLH